MILWTFVIIVMIVLAGLLALLIGTSIIAIWPFILGAWIFFAIFTLYFFRDPEARVPAAPGLIVSPGHGKVDAIDEVNEPEFMGGTCQRVSMFLSVVDVHVQNAPISGTVKYSKYKAGKFLNAIKTECATQNECVMMGFDSAERPGEKIGVKLIAGLIARRIVPWAEVGDVVTRGERISLIQFGSRVDLYLPRSAKLRIKLGDKLVGGESIVAVFE
jgi:phosphatidylserine decarboxylase